MFVSVVAIKPKSGLAESMKEAKRTLKRMSVWQGGGGLGDLAISLIQAHPCFEFHAPNCNMRSQSAEDLTCTCFVKEILEV